MAIRKFPIGMKVLSFSMALAATACSKNNPITIMGDMRDTTQTLAGDTHDMKNDTAIVKPNVVSTAANTEAMNTNVTQGNALELRNHQIEAMEKDDSPVEKVLRASAYFAAEEFQLKPGADFGRELFLEEAASGMRELFVRVQKYANTDTELDTSVTSSNSDLQNLYALSAGIGTLNPHNETATVSGLGKNVSVLDLIEDTLTKRNQLRSARAKVEDYQQLVLEYEKESVYLIQLRSNFLPAMTLKRISDLADGTGFWGGIGNFFKKVTEVGLGHWTPRVDGMTAEKISETAEWMREALRCHLFLKEIGVNPQPDKDVIRAYSKMKEMQAVDERVPDSKAKNGEIARLNAAIKSYFEAVSGASK